MFDVIPRWALALGIGAISAAGVTTVALESLGTSQPACASAHSAVVDSSSCAKGDAVTGAAGSALASIDQLKAQLTSSVSSAQSQVEGIVANAKSQVASASTSAQSTLGQTMATVTGQASLTPAFTTASDALGKVFNDVTNALNIAQVNANGAFSIASSGVRKVRIDRTGPKISSCAIR